MSLKRLWDTENKKIVWAIPTWDPHTKLQVWTNDDGSKLYVYTWSAFRELNLSSDTVSEYWPVWKALDDEMVGYYLTNVPTDLYNRDEWDEVTYTFKDYDGTVLKTGKVDEGTAPTPPADPTREATAQYTYTFAWWNPTVWPISKRTTYTATYTATVNQYTITFVDEDGTTELDEQTLDYWATPVYAGETPTKEATAEYTYTFSGWTPDIATVTWDAIYTATYSSTVNQYEVSIASDDETKWTVDVTTATVDYGTTITASSNVLTIGETEITATAETWYVFDSWTDDNGDPLPETVTGTLSVVAKFTSAE